MNYFNLTCGVFVYAGGRYTNAAYKIPLPQAPNHLSRILSLVLWLFFSGFFPCCVSFLGDFELECLIAVLDQLLAFPFHLYRYQRNLWRMNWLSQKSSQLRQKAEDQHYHLKNVKITGFSSAKGFGWADLLYPQERSVTWLPYLGHPLWFNSEVFWQHIGQCSPLGNGSRVARRALVAITTYIKDKVPTRVKLTVVEPCSRCHKLS